MTGIGGEDGRHVVEQRVRALGRTACRAVPRLVRPPRRVLQRVEQLGQLEGEELLGVEVSDPVGPDRASRSSRTSPRQSRSMSAPLSYSRVAMRAKVYAERLSARCRSAQSCSPLVVGKSVALVVLRRGDRRIRLGRNLGCRRRLACRHGALRSSCSDVTRAAVVHFGDRSRCALSLMKWGQTGGPRSAEGQLCPSW